MNHSFENKPLYRFFNVLLFLAYSFIVLIGIFTAYLTYQSREVTNTTVACKDGTEWNATKIHYDSSALCGICTQRNAEGNKYNYCSYENMDYSSYEVVKKEYASSWNTILYSLIVLALGFGLVDFIKLVVIYIFSGRIALEKSLLVRIIALFNSDSTQTNNTEPSNDQTFGEQYKLLVQIVEEAEILEKAKTAKQTEEALAQTNQELEEFYSQTGHNADFFENNDQMLALDIETLERYWKLKDTFNELSLYKMILDKYFDNLDVLNKELEEGLDPDKAKKRLEELQKKDSEEISKMQVNLELSRAISEELLDIKHKYGDNYKDASVKGEDIIKRVEEKHPEWKKAKQKK